MSELTRSQDPLHLLCIEPRFPGRLGPVADWLIRKRGYRCLFYCTNAETRGHGLETVGKGLQVVVYPVGGVAREKSVAWTRQLERSLCYAYGCWESLGANRVRSIDLVLGRSAGLGSTLFVPVHLPGVPVVNLFDYFFHAHENDLADGAGPETQASYFNWRRASNAVELLDLENGVAPWTPTRWQRDLFPSEYRDDFTTLFDGVDTRRAASARLGAQRKELAGRPLPEGARIVTFVARYLDRLRGFDRFLGIANRLLRARSDVICVAVGAVTVERGLDVQSYGQEYSSQLLERTPIHDRTRLWLLNSASREVVAQVLAASDLHLYPSRVYSVSRSLVEAMATGCTILAADTAPVREFLTSCDTALLLPPDEPTAWETAALGVLADPAPYRPLAEAAARRAREHFSQDATLPQLAAFFSGLVERGN